MPYRIAGIDVHKKILAVVVSNVEIESEYQFERRMFGSNPEQLRSLAEWLLEQEVEEVVIGRAGVHRLAVRDDHVLERKLKQGAQRRQRSLLMRRRSPNAPLA